MTKLLVSVKNQSESLIALNAGVDLIDLKSPQHGALGALALDEIASIVQSIQGRATISATIGDVSPDAEGVEEIVLATASCGVDFVKIAMLDVTHSNHALQKLTKLSPQVAMIAVLFAEDHYAPDILQQITSAGFVGAMLDTRKKQGLTLLDHFDLETLKQWVAEAKSLNLMTGLAGSLSCQMWPILSSFSSDYLGFRGGLCDNARDSDLNLSKLQQLLQVIQQQELSNLINFTPD